MMQADSHVPVTFFLTGRRTGDAVQPVAGLQLRPALFAGFRDLGALRYDFPVVLATTPRGGVAVESLSAVFDQALLHAAQGSDGERVRKQALRLEQEIRRLAAAGASGTLLTLFDQAAAKVASDAGFEDTRRRLRAALRCDGELVDCDAVLPQRMLRHLWRRTQQEKAQAFRQKIQRLTLKLTALLAAEEEHTPRGIAPQRLAATMGPAFAPAFDFDVMSRLLARALPREGMGVARRRRIRSLVRALETQRFFPASASDDAYGFEFDSCAAALKAWRERLPRLGELQRALAMAELEVRGEYDPARHDAVFADGPAPLPDATELAGFPDSLVCIGPDSLEGPDGARLMEVLSSGLPIKVLLQTDDLADAPAAEAPGMRARQLASLAMGLGTAYVLQASASHLLQYRERLHDGLAFPGPALFSVYSGAGAATGLPPYLLAAAAMEARVFPAFVYDPGAGATWAARFSLDGNPQVEQDWPVRQFSYEDAQFQSATRELAFTAADFLAADPRHAANLARVSPAACEGVLASVPEALAGAEQASPSRVPSVPMVDAQDRLHEVVLSRAVLRQAARCRDMWHSLQELAGINNSHAQRLLARAESEWRERLRQQAESAPASTPAGAAPSVAASAAAPAAAAVAAAPVAVVAVEEPERDPDQAYIETARCSTCNECIQLNGKMFAYDDNKQAYIADVNAGTYAQLVEAAENCQVAVIHPGKPRNPDEPGLEELLKRAEAFA